MPTSPEVRSRRGAPIHRHFSDAEVREALGALEAGVQMPEVCRRIGVSELTLTRWRRRAGLLRVAGAPPEVTPLDPEQATHRIAGLERRLDAFREVLTSMLPPGELERAARALAANLSMSARQARALLGLPPQGSAP